MCVCVNPEAKGATKLQGASGEAAKMSACAGQRRPRTHLPVLSRKRTCILDGWGQAENPTMKMKKRMWKMSRLRL